MGVEAALGGEQGGQESDGSGPRDQYLSRHPGCSAPDPLDVVPGLGDDSRRLQQDCEVAEGGVYLDDVFGVDPEAFGGEAVTSLYTPFGVLPVDAHVPVPGRARRAGNGIAAPYNTDHQVSDMEVGPGRCLKNPSKRLVAEDQAVVARRRRTVLAADDLQIGAADANRLSSYEYRAIRLRAVPAFL